MDSLPILAQTAQMAAVVLVAVLLWPVVRVTRERYLEYWARGWAMLAVALVAAFFTSHLPSHLGAPARVVYLLGSYGFGYLLWAGSRTYATGRPTRWQESVALLPVIAYAVLGPFLIPSIGHLFAWHAAILTVFFVAALYETRRFYPRGQSVVGLRVYQGALIGLAVLFAHYAVLILWRQVYQPAGYRYSHLAYSSLYDMAAQAVLALGMVTIATERMRAELTDANRRLRAAVTELAQASRTDPLTGLLNRRALDDLLADPLKVPAGCVAVLDVNDLKPLNDRHGHDAGDVALQLLARALRNLFRVTDPLFRMGGDEFLVLMPGGAADELVRRMHALDRTLLGQRLAGVPQPLDLSVSWGVARYTDHDSLATALKAADDAMYAQKKDRKGESGR